MNHTFKRETASADLVNILLKYAIELGLDRDNLMSIAHIKQSSLDNNDSRISIRRFNELWNAVVRESRDPNFGLHYGEQYHRLMERHLLFSVMTSCSTVYQAIQKNFLYHSLMLDNMQPIITKGQESTHKSWRISFTSTTTNRQFSESVISIFATILRYLTEGSVAFQEIRFRHSRPLDVLEHNRIFKAPLRFDQDRDEIIIESIFLEQPVFLANEELEVTLEKLARKKLHRIYLPDSWSDQVVQIVWKGLIQGSCVDIDLIAREMVTGSRTLQNRLKQEGTTFRKILAMVRKELASDYLRNNRVSICEVALLLGYADQSAFNKAFKKWNGITPREFRLQRQS